MDISIGSYKLRVEILILIVIVFWIMFGHVLCSCCTMSAKEGFAMAAGALAGKPVKRAVVGSTIYNNNNDTTTTTEGFVGSNNAAFGPEFSGAKSPDYILNPDTWSRPTLLYTPGTRPDAGVQSIWDRKKQPIPLPPGEMYFFAKTPFKPECCPSYMSSSTGCACMTVDQYNYLKDRGGNNVPYSEY
jgi:hypothetical protein